MYVRTGCDTLVDTTKSTRPDALSRVRKGLRPDESLLSIVEEGEFGVGCLKVCFGGMVRDLEPSCSSILPDSVGAGVGAPCSGVTGPARLAPGGGVVEPRSIGVYRMVTRGAANRRQTVVYDPSTEAGLAPRVREAPGV